MRIAPGQIESDRMGWNRVQAGCVLKLGGEVTDLSVRKKRLQMASTRWRYQIYINYLAMLKKVSYNWHYMLYFSAYNCNDSYYFIWYMQFINAALLPAFSFMES